jgi:hypothetical protein
MNKRIKKTGNCHRKLKEKYIKYQNKRINGEKYK